MLENQKKKLLLILCSIQNPILPRICSLKAPQHKEKMNWKFPYDVDFCIICLSSFIQREEPWWLALSRLLYNFWLKPKVIKIKKKKDKWFLLCFFKFSPLQIMVKMFLILVFYMNCTMYRKWEYYFSSMKGKPACMVSCTVCFHPFPLLSKNISRITTPPLPFPFF